MDIDMATDETAPADKAGGTTSNSVSTSSNLQQQQAGTSAATSGMYGSSMYGGYGGMGGMYGRSMYGGYGGMYGGYGGMYGGYGMGMMGGGSQYADGMFRMTQMLEMNSMMLDQMQEHVSMTYNRLRDVAVWIWALKDWTFKSGEKTNEESNPEGCAFESAEAKDSALQRVRTRLRVLAALAGIFLLLVIRDTWRKRREFELERVWLKHAGGLLAEKLPVAAINQAVRQADMPGSARPGMGPMGMGGMGSMGMGGMGSMGMGFGSLYS